MYKTEKTNSFYAIVTWLVEGKENRNRQYKWKKREIDHVKLGLSLMEESQRAAFLERFKGYQIIKALDEEEYSIESCIIGTPER